MQLAKYLHLYADETGESHFEDLELELELVDFAPPAAPLNFAKFLPTKQSVWVGAPGDWAGEKLHPSPRRQIFCTVKGEYEVTASDGTVRSFPPGSILYLEDTWGKGHSTSIISPEGALVFGVYVDDASTP